MVDKWVGKVAVVTGSSAGIGAAIFKDFAKHGITVVGLARRVERVEETIKQLGQIKGKAFAYKCDVSDPKSVTEAFTWIESKFGVVNILVNNAGIGRNVNILTEGDEAFQKMNEIIDTNVIGLVSCTREAYRLMKKSDDYSLIININSIAGHKVPFVGVPMSLYPASKHAVTALTETLRQELVVNGSDKIRVTSLSPGVVATEIFAASGRISGNSDTSEAAKVIANRAQLKAEDVSHSVLFLLSTPYNVNISELTIKPVGEKF